jgi:hypothetical protein
LSAWLEKLSDALGLAFHHPLVIQDSRDAGVHNKENRQTTIKTEATRKGHQSTTARGEKEMRRVVLLCKQVLPC